MDRWLSGLLTPWEQLLSGCLHGIVMLVLLKAVKRLITLHPSIIAREFATYAYWILAGTGAVALYFISLRHNPVARTWYVMVAFYVGVALPFAVQAGGFRYLSKMLFRRQRPIERAADPAADNLQLPPSRGFFERTVLSSAALSTAALSLWAVSLVLPTWTDASGTDFPSGGTILMTGWVGALGLQFAWFANPMLWWAFIRVQDDRSAAVPAWLAVVLSLNTMTLKYTPGVGVVYGYGWGMVVWFMAIALMLAAAGAVELRGGHHATFENGGWLRPLGLGLCAVMGIGAAVLSAADHQGANADEQVRLQYVAIKADEVCRTEFSKVVEPLTAGDGTVEVRLIDHTPAREFSTGKGLVAALLDWGVEKVRFEGRDFFYTQPGPHRVQASLPASGDARALIELTEDRETLLMRIHAADGRQIVEQSWKKSVGKRPACPAYSLEASTGQQPHLLVSKALSIAPTAAVAHQPSTVQTRANGQILNRTVGPVTAPVRYSALGCPDSIGWLEQDRPPAPVKSYSSRPLHIGERRFYLDSYPAGNALCEGDYLYLYQDNGSTDSHELSIEKRRLSDFAWAGSTVISVQDHDLRSAALQLDHITESPEGYSVDISSPAKGLYFTVKASFGLNP